MILRENKKPELFNEMKAFLPLDNNSKTLEEFTYNYLSLKNENKGVLYYTLRNYLLILTKFSSSEHSEWKQSLEFVLTMINVISNL